MLRFTQASAITNTDDPNVFTGEIAQGWDIVGNTNGGYMMAMFARAALESSGRKDIISVSAHFLSPGRVGPVTARVEPIKQGKRFATSRVDLLSPDKTLLSGTVITGDLDDGEGPTRISAVAPDVPPLDECIRVVGTELFPPPFVDRIDQRIDPATSLGSINEPRIQGRVLLDDGEPLDTIGLVFASDCMPPTVFNTDLGAAWVPTVQMTIHIRNRPTSNEMLLVSESRVIDGGMFEVDNTIFDTTGTVLAQSRQLQLLGLITSN